MPSRVRVLIVEDDFEFRYAIADALRNLGWDVRGAADGFDALGTLREWRPDVILLDLMLPMMDGWAFRLEAERQQALGEIPIIVTSGSADVRREAEQSRHQRRDDDSGDRIIESFGDPDDDRESQNRQHPLARDRQAFGCRRECDDQKRRDRSQQSQRNSDNRELQSLSKNQLENIRRLRSECETYAEFVPAIGDVERHHSVDSRQRQKQCGRSEPGEQPIS